MECGTVNLQAGLVAIGRVKFLKVSRDAVADIYPTAEEARITVAIVHAARNVRALNFKYLSEGKSAPATARFGGDGMTSVDRNRVNEEKLP